MRPRAAAVVFLLVPLASAWAPVGLADPILPQNDAGSGGDAGDTLQTATRVGPGVFAGELLTTPFNWTGTHAGDSVDWYKFHVEERKKVRWLLHHTAVTNGVMESKVVTPEGTIVRIAQADNGFASLITHRTGDWFLGVQTNTYGGTYEVTLQVLDTDPTHVVGALASYAYLVLGFDWGTGPAAVEGSVTHRMGATESRPSTIQYLQFTEEDGIFGGAWSSDTAMMTGARVRVGDDEFAYQVRQKQECPCAGGAHPIHRPSASFEGRSYDASIAASSWNYVYYDLKLVGNVTFVGATSAPLHELVILRHADFHGLLTIQALSATAAASVEATRGFQHHMLGSWNCGGGVQECGIIDPSGNPFVPETTTIFSNLAGQWTFSRNVDVSLGGEQDLLVAADAVLPGEDDGTNPDCHDLPGHGNGHAKSRGHGHDRHCQDP